MKILYITTDAESIRQQYKQYCKTNGLTFLEAISEQNFIDAYKYTKNCLVFARGLNKWLKIDILLKVLEDYDNNIVAVSETDKIKPAVKARFEQIIYNNTNNKLSYAEALKKQHDNLQFYIDLADSVIYDTTIHDKLAKLQKINEITKTIQLCTNNILWESLYDTLIYG